MCRVGQDLDTFIGDTSDANTFLYRIGIAKRPVQSIAYRYRRSSFIGVAKSGDTDPCIIIQ